MGIGSWMWGQLKKPVPNDGALEAQAASGLLHLAEGKGDEPKEEDEK